MNRLIAEQLRRNRETRDAWDSFASHRRMITELLVARRAPEHHRMCVLGAGNCNDLDLNALAAAYDEVHLVDLDREALAAGVKAHTDIARDRIHLHGGVDLTGVADTIGSWSPDALPSHEALDRCLKHLAEPVRLSLPAPFDVVASTCLLTQMIEGAVLGLGDRHPRFMELATAIRLQHLRLMFDLLAPAGRTLLITDVVSSDTFPALVDVPDNGLQAVLIQLINARNFFTGVNPVVLQSIFRTDPLISPRVASAEIVGPWKWHLQWQRRVYAVCAVDVRRVNE